MKILKIEVEGFLSIGNAAVDLVGKGTVLVEGVNHDSPADSNGAGKSSVFEALHWGLYGSTRRAGLGADDIINRHTKTGATVVVLFEKRGQIYTVKRARKSKEHGTGLWLYDGGGGDLTKGTVKDTQAALEEIIGLSQVAFQKAVYFGQGDVKPIAELTDGELKSVFEQGLGLSQLPVDYQKVFGYRKGLESQIGVKTGARSTAQILLDAEGKNLAEKEEAVKNFMEDKVRKITLISEQMSEAREALNALLVLTRNLGEEKAKLATEIAGLKGKLEGMAEIDVRVGDKLAGINAEIARLTTMLPMIGREKTKLFEEAAKVEAGAGAKCEYCGLVMDESAVATSVGRVKEKLSSVTAAEEKANAARKATQAEREKTESVYKPFKAKMIELETQLTDANTKAHKVAITLAEKNTAALGKKAELSSLESQYEAARAETGEALKKAVDAAKAVVFTREAEISNLEYEINDLSVKLETAKLLESALGNGGLKSLVFERVTPAINRYANEFLSAIDPGVSVEVSTVSYLKTGDAREKFSVAVDSRAGSKGYAGHSGGEKQKINLSISLAFNRLMRESSTDVPDLLVLDEPFEALDAGSSEQVVELLAGLGADNVFLITHNQSVKDLLPGKMTVEKRDGISFIGG